VVAVTGAQRSAAQLAEAREAMRRYEAAVASERQRFQLGTSTLFDVILAEDGLTAASLSEIDARLRLAIGIARVGFESGTLVRSDGEISPARIAERLLRPQAGAGIR
jgi:outer membrane protein TolC